MAFLLVVGEESENTRTANVTRARQGKQRRSESAIMAKTATSFFDYPYAMAHGAAWRHE